MGSSMQQHVPGSLPAATGTRGDTSTGSNSAGWLLPEDSCQYDTAIRGSFQPKLTSETCLCIGPNASGHIDSTLLPGADLPSNQTSGWFAPGAHRSCGVAVICTQSTFRRRSMQHFVAAAASLVLPTITGKEAAQFILRWFHI